MVAGEEEEDESSITPENVWDLASQMEKGVSISGARSNL